MSHINEYSSDSSDDDVCFGKYTLEEAKRDWHKYIGKKVNRRHTTICKLKEVDDTASEEVPKMAKTMEDEHNPFQYMTPNDSISTDRSSQNSEFLEKLTKVINEPLSEASSYHTACDQSNVFDNKNNKYEDTFLERINNHATFALDNVHHTLVENTVIDSEESLVKTSNYNNRREDSYDSEAFYNNSIITISDESLQLENSSNKVEPDEQLNISENQVMLINRGSSCKKCLSESNKDEDLSNNSHILVIKKEADHTNSLYETSNFLDDKNHEHYSLLKESQIMNSSFGLESLTISDSDSESKEHSFNVQSEDGSENLKDREESSEEICFDLNKLSSEPLWKNQRVIVDCNQLSKISEKTEFTIDDSSNIKLPKETTKLTRRLEINNLEMEKDLEGLGEHTRTNLDTNVGSDICKDLSISGLSPLTNDSKDFKDLQVSRCTESTENVWSSSGSVPEIQVRQLDNTSEFDDTLEEINKFLAQGENYDMSNITPSKVTPRKDDLFTFNDDIISGSFLNSSSNSAGLRNNTPIAKTLSTNSLEKCKKFYSAERITKPMAEVKVSSASAKSKYQYKESKLKPPSVSARNLFSNIEKSKAEGAFKVPTKPVKKLPTPSKLSNGVLKNIVSPVGVYINHSPKYCPLIKAPQCTGIPSSRVASKLVKPNPTSVKENLSSLSNEKISPLIYKPANTKVTTEENDLVLPESIKKLMKIPVVIKHESRIKGDECNQSIDRRLMESDLSIDLSHNSQDISLLTNKQAFNVRRF